jgi:hypothetical protein
MIRTYSELIQFDSFIDRFRYLSLHGVVGAATFGSERWLNQDFYRSREWKQVRSHVIVRDNGCDLGVEDLDIFDNHAIHHMNPMTSDHIRHGDPSILDPEFLITTSHTTHNAIHYGDESQLPRSFIERFPGDTKLW